jgi:hypothetical protein
MTHQQEEFTYVLDDGVNEFIRLGKGRIRVIWWGKDEYKQIEKDTKAIFDVTNTRVRVRIVYGSEQWMKTLARYSTLVPTDDKMWMDTRAKKMTVLEVLDKWEGRGFFPFENSKLVDRLFFTVYDTSREKKLILDGLHRALSITQAIKEYKLTTFFPALTILEAYGPRVDMIFPADLHQL